MAHPRFPDVSHREQKRPLTHFSFSICHFGNENTLTGHNPSSSDRSGNHHPAPHRPLWHIPDFLMCHIGSKNAPSHTFPSPSVTSGNHHPAPHRPLWHIPDFLMCHIGSKNAPSHTFPSPSVTSGNHHPAPHRPLWHIPDFLMCHIGSKNAPSRLSEKSAFQSTIGLLRYSGRGRSSRRGTFRTNSLTHFSFPICHFGEG